MVCEADLNAGETSPSQLEKCVYVMKWSAQATSTLLTGLSTLPVSLWSKEIGAYIPQEIQLCSNRKV